MVVGGLLALVSHVRARVTLNLLMTLVIKVLIYQISRILYHIFLHHLAKFPGPPLRSGLFIINYLDELRGIQPKKALALHDRYGSVARIGPDCLSFNTVKAWKGMPNIPLRTNEQVTEFLTRRYLCRKIRQARNTQG